MYNVAQIASGKIYAGLENQVQNVAIGLREYSKHRAQVILFHDNLLARRLRENNIDVRVVPLNSLNFIKSIKRIEKILIAEKIDILHSHGYKANIAAYCASRKIERICRIRTEHGLPEPFSGYKLLKYKLYDYYDRRIAKHYTDRVIAVSKDVEEYLLRFLPKTKIARLQNSIGPSQPCDAERVNRIKAELGIPPGGRTIGIIGRLFPVKNHRLFIDTMVRLSELEKDVIGLIVGSGPMESDLKEYAVKQNVSERIIFAGFRDDIPLILRALDALIFTSLHEGLPMVLLEAMSMETPVISVKTGGLFETLRDCCDEGLVDSYDPDQLARKCLQVLNDSALRNRMTEAAKRKVRECYSLESYIRRLSAIYDEAMSR